MKFDVYRNNDLKIKNIPAIIKDEFKSLKEENSLNPDIFCWKLKLLFWFFLIIFIRQGFNVKSLIKAQDILCIDYSKLIRSRTYCK